MWCGLPFWCRICAIYAFPCCPSKTGHAVYPISSPPFRSCVITYLRLRLDWPIFFVICEVIRGSFFIRSYVSQNIDSSGSRFKLFPFPGLYLRWRPRHCPSSESVKKFRHISIHTSIITSAHHRLWSLVDDRSSVQPLGPLLLCCLSFWIVLASRAPRLVT